jgi:hypothetical protein
MVDTNQNVDYKSIRVDTGAPNAARDAELFRSTAGAGTATPDQYLGGVSTLAGAQSVEVAVVKAFEDYQTDLRNDNIELSAYVLSVAQGTTVAEALSDARSMAWSFPPIITQDIVKWVTAFAQWEQQVGPKNREVRLKAIRMVGEVLGVPDIDMIWDDIEKEEKRLATEEDAKNAASLQAQQAGAVARANGLANGFGNGFGGNSNGGAAPAVPADKSNQNGQKATTGPVEQGASPDITRLQKGRPPRENATGPRTSRQ